MKLKPLFDRVVLKPLENEKETKGGIILPTAAQEKSQLAEVVAVGNGMNFQCKLRLAIRCFMANTLAQRLILTIKSAWSFAKLTFWLLLNRRRYV